MMFSPNDWIFVDDNDSNSAFRMEAPINGKLPDKLTGSDPLMSAFHTMNPPPKRGKYSMMTTADGEEDDEAEGTSSSGNRKLKEGWKQCDHVSNRTRLRCKNIRRMDQLKEYGFCEAHQGYIFRVKKQGLRTKQSFDATYTFDEKSNQLLSCADDDETLEPTRSSDFPFVYESMYCDSRLDNDENPLRRAGVFTNKEIAREFLNALHRHDASVQQLRVIYSEKHRRILHQIASLKGKSQLTKLDPVKDAKKIQRLLAMRRYVLARRGMDRILEDKIFRTEQSVVDASEICRKTWLKQLDEPLDEDEMAAQMVVSEMIDLVAEASSDAELTPQGMRAMRRKHFMDRPAPLSKNIVAILDEFRKQSTEAKEEKLLAPVKCLPIVQQIQASERQSISKGGIPKLISPTPSTSMASSADLVASDHTINNKAWDNNNIGTRICRKEPYGSGYRFDGITQLRPSTSAAAINLNNTYSKQNGGKKVIRPVAIDEDISPDLYLQMTFPQMVNDHPMPKAIAQPRKVEVDKTEVCARIDRPWDGTRRAVNLANSQQQQQPSQLDTTPSNNDNDGNALNDSDHCYPLRNRQSSSGGTVVPEVPQQLKTTPNRKNNNNNVVTGNYGSYQQYLSMQRLIPTGATTMINNHATTAVSQSTTTIHQLPATNHNNIHHQTQPQRASTRQVNLQQQHHQQMYGANYGSSAQRRGRVRGCRGRGGIKRGALPAFRFPHLPTVAPQHNNNNSIAEQKQPELRDDTSPPPPVYVTRRLRQQQQICYATTTRHAASSSDKFHRC